jgi:hypothetical protein
MDGVKNLKRTAQQSSYYGKGYETFGNLPPPPQITLHYKPEGFWFDSRWYLCNS